MHTVVTRHDPVVRRGPVTWSPTRRRVVRRMVLTLLAIAGAWIAISLVNHWQGTDTAFANTTVAPTSEAAPQNPFNEPGTTEPDADQAAATGSIATAKVTGKFVSGIDPLGSHSSRPVDAASGSDTSTDITTPYDGRGSHFDEPNPTDQDAATSASTPNATNGPNSPDRQSESVSESVTESVVDTVVGSVTDALAPAEPERRTFRSPRPESPLKLDLGGFDRPDFDAPECSGAFGFGCTPVVPGHFAPMPMPVPTVPSYLPPAQHNSTEPAATTGPAAKFSAVNSESGPQMFDATDDEAAQAIAATTNPFDQPTGMGHADAAGTPAAVGGSGGAPLSTLVTVPFTPADLSTGTPVVANSGSWRVRNEALEVSVSPD